MRQNEMEQILLTGSEWGKFMRQNERRQTYMRQNEMRPALLREN